jgi:hypothetical protein
MKDDSSRKPFKLESLDNAHLADLVLPSITGDGPLPAVPASPLQKPANDQGVTLRPCPAPGHGVHNWIMAAGWDAKKSGLSAEEAVRAIFKAITREPGQGEIEEALKRVYESTSVEIFSTPIKAEYEPDKLETLAAKAINFSERDLLRRSLIRPDTCSTIDFLRALYAPGERVAILSDQRRRECTIWACTQSVTACEASELDGFKKPAEGMGVWFLANPVTGEWHYIQRLVSERNPMGMTLRAEECLTSYRFMLIESDEAPTDLWIKAIVQLPLPIVSIATSGGRSVHALVKVDAASPEEWDGVKAKIGPALVRLGACKGSLSLVRLTRLPGCYRAEKDGWQRLLYLNPNADGTPICNLPNQRHIDEADSADSMEGISDHGY